MNSGIDSDRFPTEWVTFSATSEMILDLPTGCQAAAFDISAAYWITPVLLSQQHALCVFWKGKVYINRAVAFGMSSSAGVFGAVADLLMAIYRASGFALIMKWVDDFLVIRLPHQTWVESDFTTLTESLGVPWSHAKTKPLASQQRYIGFDWDLNEKTVSFPTEKLAAALALLDLWLTPNACFSMKQASTLHGRLVHAATIYPLVRPFVWSASVFVHGF